MNDRFRFRVWNKKTNKMYSQQYDESLTYGMEYANINVVLNTQDDDQFNIEDEDLIIMQCTGLKDRDGKWIYEGDVLGYPTFGFAKIGNLFGRTYAYKMEVKWDDINASFSIDHPNCLPYMASRCDIIGNIHENKELLS